MFVIFKMDQLPTTHRFNNASSLQENLSITESRRPVKLTDLGLYLIVIQKLKVFLRLEDKHSAATTNRDHIAIGNNRCGV
jgi:hypothetical protein